MTFSTDFTIFVIEYENVLNNMRNTVLLQMVATEIAAATDLMIDTTIETTTTVLYKRVGSKRAGGKPGTKTLTLPQKSFHPCDLR